MIRLNDILFLNYLIYFSICYTKLLLSFIQTFKYVITSHFFGKSQIKNRKSKIEKVIFRCNLSYNQTFFENYKLYEVEKLCLVESQLK